MVNKLKIAEADKVEFEPDGIALSQDNSLAD